MVCSNHSYNQYGRTDVLSIFGLVLIDFSLSARLSFSMLPTTLLPPLVANGLLLLALLRFVCLPLLALLRRVLYGGPGDMPKRYGEWAIVTGASDGIGLA